MEIEYKGANCVVITTKKATLAVDPRLSTAGLKDVAPKNAIVLATQSEFATESEVVTIDRPGEYEVSNITVVGVPAKRLIDHEDVQKATMYRVATGDVTVAIIGHVVTPLSEEQLEALGVVDVAIVPVGGNGYTLDAHQAVALVRQLDPKIVIPTHFADKGIKYEVDQTDLEPFLKELGAEQHETMPKWKVKNGVIPDTLQVIELTRTA
jgi:L-ascorbate metabolism protein UlaG (beta-lactamase superfamily)